MSKNIEGVPFGSYCYGYFPAPESGFATVADVEAFLTEKHGSVLSSDAMQEWSQLLIVRHCRFWAPTDHGFVECRHLARRALLLSNSLMNTKCAEAYFGGNGAMENEVRGFLLGDAVKECRLNRDGPDFEYTKGP